MRFATELAIANREISRVRIEVAHSDTASLSIATPVRERAALSKASAYIWLAAMLERLARDSLAASFREITTHQPSCRDLKLSLFALLCDGDFESVATKARGSSWERKVSLFEKTFDSSAVFLSDHVLPLDGKTIRAEHLDAIWLVLGIGGDSTPSPLHRIALKELADGRNDVAHGHLDPVLFGRQKATSDLVKMVNRVEDVVIHLLSALDDYIKNKRYVR